MRCPTETSGEETAGEAVREAASEAAPPARDGSGVALTAEVFALCLVAAAGLQAMENLLPRIPLFPWLRLGLSYAVILPFLLRFGVWPALVLLLSRNGMTLLFGGQPLSTFLIGSGSGLASFLLLGGPIRWAISRNLMGLAGAGILLATGFNVAQLLLVKWTLIRHAGFLVQAGPMLAWSLVSGVAVALVAGFSAREIGRALDGEAPASQDWSPRRPRAMERPGLPEGRPALAVSGLGALIVVFLVPSPAVQAAALALLAGISGLAGCRLLKTAWPLFLYLAWFHLRGTPGALLPGGWTTHEGMEAFAFHALRLGNILLAGRFVSAHMPWARLGGRESVYGRGFAMALPLMPGLFPRSLAMGRQILRDLRAGRREGLLAGPLETWRRELGGVGGSGDSPAATQAVTTVSSG